MELWQIYLKHQQRYFKNVLIYQMNIRANTVNYL
jgi:hypothetical protein